MNNSRYEPVRNGVRRPVVPTGLKKNYADIYFQIIMIQMHLLKCNVDEGLKENYTDDKYFHILYISNYWTHFCWFYSKHGCIYHKMNIKSDYPHHTIIKHCAICWMCGWDSKASTDVIHMVFQWAWRTHSAHGAMFNYRVAGKIQFLLDFLTNTAMFWIKPLLMYI